MAVCSDDPELQRMFRGHKDAVTSLAFCGVPASASGRAGGEPRLVSGSLDGGVMVWHAAQHVRAFRYIGHSDAVHSVAYDSTANLIASASKDKTVRLWQPSAEGRSTVLKAHTAAVRCCAFGAGGRLLATASDDKSLKVWGVPQRAFLCSLTGHTNWVRSCELAPDGRLAVSGGDDHSVRVWDLEARATLAAFDELEGAVHVARFHPDGARGPAPTWRPGQARRRGRRRAWAPFRPTPAALLLSLCCPRPPRQATASPQAAPTARSSCGTCGRGASSSTTRRTPALSPTSPSTPPAASCSPARRMAPSRQGCGGAHAWQRLPAAGQGCPRQTTTASS